VEQVARDEKEPEMLNRKLWTDGRDVEVGVVVMWRGMSKGQECDFIYGIQLNRYF